MKVGMNRRGRERARRMKKSGWRKSGRKGGEAEPRLLVLRAEQERSKRKRKKMKK